MNFTFLRISAFFLIPCLVAEPVLADGVFITPAATSLVTAATHRCMQEALGPMALSSSPRTRGFARRTVILSVLLYVTVLVAGYHYRSELWNAPTTIRKSSERQMELISLSLYDRDSIAGTLERLRAIEDPSIFPRVLAAAENAPDDDRIKTAFAEFFETARDDRAYSLLVSWIRSYEPRIKEGAHSRVYDALLTALANIPHRDLIPNLARTLETADSTFLKPQTAADVLRYSKDPGAVFALVNGAKSSNPDIRTSARENLSVMLAYRIAQSKDLSFDNSDQAMEDLKVIAQKAPLYSQRGIALNNVFNGTEETDLMKAVHIAFENAYRGNDVAELVSLGRDPDLAEGVKAALQLIADDSTTEYNTRAARILEQLKSLPLIPTPKSLRVPPNVQGSIGTSFYSGARGRFHLKNKQIIIHFSPEAPVGTQVVIRIRRIYDGYNSNRGIINPREGSLVMEVPASRQLTVHAADAAAVEEFELHRAEEISAHSGKRAWNYFFTENNAIAPVDYFEIIDEPLQSVETPPATDKKASLQEQLNNWGHYFMPVELPRYKSRSVLLIAA